MEGYDIIVVGAGPAGLAAAKSACRYGASKVLLLEREKRSGGILMQCIHDGFGLFYYDNIMTGPEYALRARRDAVDAGVEIRTDTIVTDVSKGKVITAVSPHHGVEQYKAGAIILATGCRERTRGAISIPGSRPAGVFTAGVVQNLLNIRNVMVGKKIVILGSGDIGLIMARRLKLEGAEVLAVIEINDSPNGLQRNVSQCIYDYNIPLYVRHTITRIIGNKRVEAVEISEIDDSFDKIKGTEQILTCDTIVLSVGLIPENELALKAGVLLNSSTNGVITDEHLETNVPGIFSCGNSRSVMDLADFVSEQGEIAGKNAVDFIRNRSPQYTISDAIYTMHKGFPEEDSITCPQCPKGCRIKYLDDLNVVDYGCAKGKSFALQEKVEPRRILTTTMKTKTGSLVPVKSSKGIPKSEIINAIRYLREIPALDLPMESGMCIMTDIMNLGVEIVTTDEMK